MDCISDGPGKQKSHTFLEATTDSITQPRTIHRARRHSLQSILSNTYFTANLVRRVDPNAIPLDSLCVYRAALTCTNGAQQHIPTKPEKPQIFIILEEH